MKIWNVHSETIHYILTYFQYMAICEIIDTLILDFENYNTLKPDHQATENYCTELRSNV